MAFCADDFCLVVGVYVEDVALVRCIWASTTTSSSSCVLILSGDSVCALAAIVAVAHNIVANNLYFMQYAKMRELYFGRENHINKIKTDFAEQHHALNSEVVVI